LLTKMQEVEEFNRCPERNHVLWSYYSLIKFVKYEYGNVVSEEFMLKVLDIYEKIINNKLFDIASSVNVVIKKNVEEDYYIFYHDERVDDIIEDEEAITVLNYLHHHENKENKHIQFSTKITERVKQIGDNFKIRLDNYRAERKRKIQESDESERERRPKKSKTEKDLKSYEDIGDDVSDQCIICLDEENKPEEDRSCPKGCVYKICKECKQRMENRCAICRATILTDGRRQKKSTKRRSIQRRRSVQRRSVKRRSVQRRSVKRRSVQRRSVQRRSVKRRSVKRRSVQRR